MDRGFIFEPCIVYSKNACTNTPWTIEDFLRTMIHTYVPGASVLPIALPRPTALGPCVRFASVHVDCQTVQSQPLIRLPPTVSRIP